MGDPKKLNFLQQLKLGYVNYWKGILFLIQHKLYWFVAFPIIIFIGIYWMGFQFQQMEWGIHAEIKNNAQEFTSLNQIIWRTIKMIMLDALYVIFTKSTLYIVIMILSPIIAILSERIETILTGNKYPFSVRQIINDIKRGIRIAFRNLFWEFFLFAIIVGVGALIGGTSGDIIILSIPVVIGFYFYGFSFIDYVNERRRLNIQQSIYFVSKHKGLAIAIGSIYSIFFLSYTAVYRQFDQLSSDTATQLLWASILVITFVLATIAPILAITSATLSMHELVDLTENEHAIKTESANILAPKEEISNQDSENTEPLAPEND